MPDLPGERDLQVLARRFASAERRVRDLLGRHAADRHPRDRLTESLAIFVGLRKLDMRGPVFTAYRSAAGEAARPGRVSGLAAALHQKLDTGAQTAAEGSRRAFKAATLEALEDLRLEAVTAFRDEQGQRWALGRYAEMQTQTIGRQASSLGVVDAVGDGLVVVEGSSGDSICGPLIGWSGPASAAPQPPFHAACQCLLVPA